MYIHQMRIKVMIKRIFVQGTGACTGTVPEDPHENFIRRFQLKNGEGRYFKINKWE
jgi:hypothetical protein